MSASLSGCLVEADCHSSMNELIGSLPVLHAEIVWYESWFVCSARVRCRPRLLRGQALVTRTMDSRTYNLASNMALMLPATTPWPTG